MLLFDKCKSLKSSKQRNKETKKTHFGNVKTFEFYVNVSKMIHVKSRLTTNAPYYFIKVKLINNTQILLKMPHIYNTIQLNVIIYPIMYFYYITWTLNFENQ